VKSFADEFDRATRRARYYQRTSNGECSALDAIPGRRSAVRMGLQSTDAVAPESSIFTGIFETELHTIVFEESPVSTKSGVLFTTAIHLDLPVALLRIHRANVFGGR
jgi:hypothetical protein